MDIHVGTTLIHTLKKEKEKRTLGGTGEIAKKLRAALQGSLCLSVPSVPGHMVYSGH